MISDDLRVIYNALVKLSQEKNIVEEIESIMGTHLVHGMTDPYYLWPFLTDSFFFQ